MWWVESTRTPTQHLLAQTVGVFFLTCDIIPFFTSTHLEHQDATFWDIVWRKSKDKELRLEVFQKNYKLIVINDTCKVKRIRESLYKDKYFVLV